MIILKPVDETSFYQVLKLKVRDEQKHWVADNAMSLAECWLYRDNGDVFPYAVWEEDEVVGFVLLDIDEEENQYMIWRLMIDQTHQGKGYGRAAVEAVIALATADPVCDHVRADYVKGNIPMADLLTRLGFEIFDQDEREFYTKRKIRKTNDERKISRSDCESR